ncbi:MAG: hypothetical protein O2887_17965 [Bacteroidetes bacterium]|nr:hypothetical protein [Bacteroidota bacterium]MDA1122342.1 hypothetical protein [Bacteroidota bacterium]
MSIKSEKALNAIGTFRSSTEHMEAIKAAIQINLKKAFEAKKTIFSRSG